MQCATLGDTVCTSLHPLSLVSRPQVYNAVKMHELQTAFKVVELKRRVAAAMRHIVDSHEHIYRDWDPRDRLLSQGGANYFKLR